MSDTFQVTTHPEKGRVRVLFEGLEDDAREFVRNNFPRLHIEPGINNGADGPAPDAVLVAPDGKTREHFNGLDWVNPDAPKGDHASDNDKNIGTVKVSDAPAPDATKNTL